MVHVSTNIYIDNQNHSASLIYTRTWRASVTQNSSKDTLTVRESCEIRVSQKLKSRMALTYFFCHSCYLHVTLVFHNSLSQCVLHNGYCSVLLMHSVRSIRHNAKLPEHTSTSQKTITYKIQWKWMELKFWTTESVGRFEDTCLLLCW